MSEKKFKSQFYGSPGACEHQQRRERFDSLARVKREKAIEFCVTLHLVAILGDDVIVLSLWLQFLVILLLFYYAVRTCATSSFP